jgi:cytochrome c oxidase subunit 2
MATAVREESTMKSSLLVLILCALGSFIAIDNFAMAQDGPRRIEVVSNRFAFIPGEITLKKGQPVVLVLKSNDVAHGLHFRELNVDIKVGKGGTAEVSFTPETAGDFVGHCSVFCGSGHGSMLLKLRVVN